MDARTPHADRRTAPDRVSERLRADILAGAFPPGARLVVAALARRYGTSAMPIRAALQELQGHGLVTQHPHQGARVRAIDAEWIENVYELRGAVLGILLPRCVRFACDADLDAIARLDAAFREAVGTGDLPRILDSNRRFHHAIYALARNPEALEVMDRTWLLVDALRMRLGFGPRRLASVLKTHAEMLTALRKRDATKATTLFQSASNAAKHDLVALAQGRPGALAGANGLG
jgi:DNA-binding GntR family transcriptional regulator